MGLGRLASPQRAAVVFGVAVLLALALSGSSLAEKPVSIEVAQPEPVFSGGVSPRTLPRSAPAPISFGVSAKLPTPPGATAPSRLRRLTIVGDDAATIDLARLPSCSANELRALAPASAELHCRQAIVGRGTVVAGGVFPGERLITKRSRIVAFNGGREAGVTTILLHAMLKVPRLTTVVAVAKVRRIERGRYGLEATVPMPRFAGGFGQVTAFDLVFQRGFLRARCPADDRLQGRAIADLANGEALETTIVNPCKTKD